MCGAPTHINNKIISWNMALSVALGSLGDSFHAWSSHFLLLMLTGGEAAMSLWETQLVYGMQNMLFTDH